MWGKQRNCIFVENEILFESELSLLMASRANLSYVSNVGYNSIILCRETSCAIGRKPVQKCAFINGNKKITVGKHAFHAISQIAAPPIPFERNGESRSLRTDDELISTSSTAISKLIFNGGNTGRVLEANFAAVNSERQSCPQYTRGCVPRSVEIESTRPITTTVYRGAYACTLPIDVPTFPIVDEMINQSPSRTQLCTSCQTVQYDSIRYRRFQ